MITANADQTSPWKIRNARKGVDGERHRRKTEEVGSIPVQLSRHSFEMDPPENEGKRDERRQHATPHDQPVSEPAERAATGDESVEREIGDDPPDPVAGVPHGEAAAEEHLPAAPPVERRRRSLQPHRVAVRDCERGEQDSKRVADQSRVEMGEIPRADHDENGQNRGEQHAPGGCPDSFDTHAKEGVHRDGRIRKHVASRDDIGHVQSRATVTVVAARFIASEKTATS